MVTLGSLTRGHSNGLLIACLRHFVVPEALSRFAEGQVHAIVSLLKWIHVSASLNPILNRHLSPVNRRLVSPIELGSAVHC